MAKSITTSTGTTVSITEGKVILEHPEAPKDMRVIEVGRIVFEGTGFQPAPFFPGAMATETLRAIADLMEGK